MKTDAKHGAVAPPNLFAYRKARYRDEDRFTADHPFFVHPEIAKPGKPTVKPPLWRYHPVMTEREALERLVDQADVLEVEERTFLLIEATPPLWDFLVTFGADREDLEETLEADTDEDEGDNFAEPTWPLKQSLPGDKQVRSPHRKDTGGAS